MNEFNRPSVIVFNTNNNIENNTNRNSVIVQNEQFVNNEVLNNNEIEQNNFDDYNNFDDDYSRDSDIVLDQNEYLENNDDIFENDNVNPEIHQVFDGIFDELSQESFNNYFDNDNDDDNNSANNVLNTELSQEDYLNIIRQNYEMLNPTNQYSRLYGMLFSHFKTKINPDIYDELQPDNFLNLFRDVFTDIFNNVLEKINRDFGDIFDQVKVNLKTSDLNVNLQFLPLSDLSSELFLLELYRVLQSKRDIVTNSEIDLSFTFLPRRNN